ncbi:hypothetical protein MASR2M41_08530 [Flammeovirgaceae bacterium]
MRFGDISTGKSLLAVEGIYELTNAIDSKTWRWIELEELGWRAPMMGYRLSINYCEKQGSSSAAIGTLPVVTNFFG